MTEEVERGEKGREERGRRNARPWRASPGARGRFTGRTSPRPLRRVATSSGPPRVAAGAPMMRAIGRQSGGQQAVAPSSREGDGQRRSCPCGPSCREIDRGSRAALGAFQPPHSSSSPPLALSLTAPTSSSSTPRALPTAAPSCPATTGPAAPPPPAPQPRAPPPTSKAASNATSPSQ